MSDLWELKFDYMYASSGAGGEADLYVETTTQNSPLVYVRKTAFVCSDGQCKNIKPLI